MADVTPTRKSGRKRDRNKKYTDDLFETLNFEISDGEDSTPLKKLIEDVQEDDDFDVGQTMEEPEISVEEDGSAADVSEGSPIATPDESERDDVSDDQLLEQEEKPRRKWIYKPPPEVHFRGLTERKNELAHGSERGFLESVIGTAKEDLATYIRARDMWANSITLPSKQIDGNGSGGMRHPFNHSPQQRRMEATVGWDWYYCEGGKASFQERQRFKPLTAEEGAQYVPKPAESSHDVLMGPYGKQKVFSLTFLQYLMIDDAWSQARAANPTVSGFTPVPKGPNKRHDGWMLNVGSSVQCLDWAPNHEDTQYLAISTQPRKDPLQRGFSKRAPAYTSLSGSSSIQIWAVVSPVTQGERTFLPPELILVICTDWGHAKQLKWCPMPRISQDDESERRVHLGLLAGVWADGCMRVLDVYNDGMRGPGTQFVKYDQALFEAKPADAMCCCTHWLSPTDIAVGCSNGYAAIWNILPPVATADAPTYSPDSTVFGSYQSPCPQGDLTARSVGPSPYFYTFLHSTYILAISSAYPTHPHLIATSSANGYLRLTDIRSPNSDYVLSQRSHWTPNEISYCAPLTCFVSYEDGGTLKLYSIRRFWTSISVGKGESEALCIGVGRLHPTIIAGFADGTLLAVNPCRRFVNTRTKSMLQQKVWKHEWARQKLDVDNQQVGEQVEGHEHTDSPNASGADAVQHARQGRTKGLSQQQDGQNRAGHSRALSRLTEGYRTEYFTLAPTKKPPRSSKQDTSTEDGLHALYSTIYDAETAIRQVVWNPNEGWGGWAASGTGCGLVRIENLAI